MNDALLDRPPVVVRRRRAAEFLFVAAGAVATLAGAGLATQGEFRFAGLPLGAVGLIVLLLGIRQARHPTVLVMEPVGLHYSYLGVNRFWRWEDLSRFRVVRIRSGRAVVFDVSRPGRRPRAFAVPGFFAMGAVPLANLLQDAHHRWVIGGSSNPPDPVPVVQG